MVDREGERLLAIGQVAERQPQEGAVLEVERQEGDLGEAPGDLRPVSEGGGIHSTEVEARRRADSLRRVRGCGVEAGADGGMGGDESAPGAPQGVGAERAAQT